MRCARLKLSGHHQLSERPGTTERHPTTHPVLVTTSLKTTASSGLMYLLGLFPLREIHGSPVARWDSTWNGQPPRHHAPCACRYRCLAGTYPSVPWQWQVPSSAKQLQLLIRNKIENNSPASNYRHYRLKNKSKTINPHQNYRRYRRYSCYSFNSK